MMAVRQIATYDSDAQVAAALHEVLSPPDRQSLMRQQILDVLKQNGDGIFAYEDPLGGGEAVSDE